MRVYYGSKLVDDTALTVEERKALVPAPRVAKVRETPKPRAF
ncbi:MAG: hypothetical protein ACT4P4_14925 [Betaproteobacteria bacterium]